MIIWNIVLTFFSSSRISLWRVGIFRRLPEYNVHGVPSEVGCRAHMIELASCARQLKVTTINGDQGGVAAVREIVMLRCGGECCCLGVPRGMAG